MTDIIQKVKNLSIGFRSKKGEEILILKNITQTNINKAFFDMNGQISIILMLTFTISTILQ